MKILVAYFSQTGNTEQIARAVHQELSPEHPVDVAKIEEIDAAGLAGYELVFVGTPIHAGGLSGPVKEMLASLPSSPAFALAGLVTHASDLYSKENYEKGLESLARVAEEKGIRYLGCFDCQGRLNPAIQPMVQKAQGLSDEEWAKRMAKTDRHPDAEDEKNAREFAREVLAKM
jgi:flavodoxin I